MSDASNRHALQSRIEERLEGIVADNQRGLGRRLGKSGQTMARWAGDLDSWKARAFLNIAREDEQLGNAVCAYVRPGVEQTTRPGEAVSLHGDLLSMAGKAGESIGFVLEAVSDGRVSDEENTKVDAQLAQLEESIAKARADLKASRIRQ